MTSGSRTPSPLPLRREKPAAGSLPYCMACGEMLEIEEGEVWKTMCSDCYAIRPRRACAVCNELAVGEDEPAWRTKCNPCYKASIEKGRKCIRCKEQAIQDDAPKWKNFCGACYTIDREENYDLCPGCVGTPNENKRSVRKDGKSRYCPQCRIARNRRTPIQSPVKRPRRREYVNPY